MRIKYDISELDIKSLYSSDEPFMLDIENNMSFLTYKQFAKDVVKAYKKLSSAESKKVLLYINDKYTFFVFLIASSFTDKNVFIPNNNKALYIKEISDDEMIYIHDCESESYDLSDLKCKTLYAFDVTNKEKAEDEECETIFKTIKQNKEMRVSFFTSGSTGTPKIIEKILRLLAIEITYLSKELEDKLKDALLTTTVSQCHLYGFTFTLLLPFSTGTLFLRNKINYAETFNNLREYKKIIFITTPSFLKRVEKKSLSIKPNWNIVAGSEMLERKLFEYVKEVFDTRIFDFYGSTETGVIANRYMDENIHFRAFDGVEIKLNEDEELMIKCPYTDNKYVRIGDVAVIENERYFSLLGRKDDLTKIEGKRINLNNINAKALENENFKDAYSLTNEINKRNVIVTFVVPKDEKMIEMPHRNRKASLINHLSLYFDKTLLPKRTVFVDAIPINANGKIDRVKLKALSEKIAVENKYSFHLTAYYKNFFEILIDIPKDSVYFEGHFDNIKILPAVAQIQIIYDVLKHYHQKEFYFKSANRIKFLNIITPGMKIYLRIKKEGDKLSFEYSSFDKKFSSGSIFLNELL